MTFPETLRLLLAKASNRFHRPVMDMSRAIISGPVCLCSKGRSHVPTSSVSRQLPKAAGFHSSVR